MSPRVSPSILVIAAVAGMLLTPIEGERALAGPKRQFRFTAAPGQSLLVHGEYPQLDSSCVNAVQPVLHARFRGTIDVARSGDGSLYLIGELGFEDYVKGIAEVPRSWPLEALKAQVVAARTYAMNRLEAGSSEGRALGYDLCATQACQVYLGMGVEAGAWGSRWVKAVEETEGQVLLHGGRPAITFYSSTSNGRTYPNEEVFGGEPLPYLRGIVEEDDGESPLARWSVRMPFDDLARFLKTVGAWGAGPIEKVSGKGDAVLIQGGGTTISMAREDLRDELNGIASCLDPDYPTSEADGYRLPQTVPSDWYEASQDGSALVLDGRGWGHGVGMVQWGAKGKADRGLSYSDILGAYYGGLRPTAIDVPSTIRVLIAEDLESITVVPSGAADVSGAKTVPSAPWLVSGGRRIRLSNGTEPEPVLLVTAEEARVSDGRVRAPVEISKNAVVRLEFLQGGVEVASTQWRPKEKGPVRIRERIPAVAAGPYSLQITATDGVDRVTVPAGDIQVSGQITSPPAPPSALTTTPPDDSPEAAPAERTDGPPMGLLIGILVALVTALLALGATRRRGAHRR
jgi:stage II sporulation protein D